MEAKSMRADDARLTAYALGELEADELAEMEAALAEDAAGQAFVRRTCELADLLGEALRTERAAERAARAERERRARRAQRWRRAGTGIAVGIAAAAAALLALRGHDDPAEQHRAGDRPTDERLAPPALTPEEAASLYRDGDQCTPEEAWAGAPGLLLVTDPGTSSDVHAIHDPLSYSLPMTLQCVEPSQPAKGPGRAIRPAKQPRTDIQATR
jgi:hypothetical protein